MVAWPKSRPTLLIVIAVGLAARATLGADRTTPSLAETISPLQARFQSMTGDELFAQLLEHNRIRDARLQQYTAMRTYAVTSGKGKIYAQEVVRVDYQAPDRKSFHTESEEGSGLVRNMVLKRLIESESDTSSGRAHHDSAIKPANYEFNLLGEQDVGPYHCLVAEATPKRKDKYLFEGTVWIDTEDYAIVRIAGQPAKSLSFWITRADFMRQYQKIGEFWLPAKDETLVHVRLYGKKILTIDHRDYAINGGAGETTRDLTAENQASEP
jgi:outer membrane lipoprotein-sorting protein